MSEVSCRFHLLFWVVRLGGCSSYNTQSLKEHTGLTFFKKRIPWILRLHHNKSSKYVLVSQTKQNATRLNAAKILCVGVGQGINNPAFDTRLTHSCELYDANTVLQKWDNWKVRLMLCALKVTDMSSRCLLAIWLHLWGIAVIITWVRIYDFGDYT